MSFWDIIWFIVVSFLFIAYLVLLFSIISDLFHDRETSGWMKALWVLWLIVLPFFTALIYVIVRGNAMAERRTVNTLRQQEAKAEYLRMVAGVDPTAQLATAKRLLDEGAITASEFAQVKNSILP